MGTWNIPDQKGKVESLPPLAQTPPKAPPLWDTPTGK